MGFSEFLRPRPRPRRPRLVADNPTVTRTPASPPPNLRVVSTTDAPPRPHQE
jgi:hypothetical protein